MELYAPKDRSKLYKRYIRLRDRMLSRSLLAERLPKSGDYTFIIVGGIVTILGTAAVVTSFPIFGGFFGTFAAIAGFGTAFYSVKNLRTNQSLERMTKDLDKLGGVINSVYPDTVWRWEGPGIMTPTVADTFAGHAAGAQRSDKKPNADFPRAQRTASHPSQRRG